MAWIESHQELYRHPKVKRLARATGASVPALIGHLHLLWWWALDYAQTGELTDYTSEDIADAALWEDDPAAFTEAVTNAGFLDRDDGRTYLHDWNDYAGKLLERRASDRERKRKSVGVPTDSIGVPADSVGVPKDSIGVPADSVGVPKDSIVTVPNLTVQNRTEPNQQNHTTPQPPASVGDAPTARVVVSSLEQRFNEFWEAYPKKTAKQTALRAWKKAAPSPELHARILAAIEAAKLTDKWRRDGGQYIPNPATWLNGGCWDDEISGGLTNGNKSQGFKPKEITFDDLPGFRNALDKYDDEGNRIPDG